MRTLRTLVIAVTLVVVATGFIVAQSTSDPAVQKAREETAVVFDLGRMFGFIQTMEEEEAPLRLDADQIRELAVIMTAIRRTERVEPDQADAWLKSVPSVDWGVYQSCMQLENVGVTAELKNFGLDAIENPDFSFRLNDGEIFTETFSGTVQPDSLLHFTFGTTIDISQVGTYELEVSVNYANDQNPGNDTYTATLEVIEGASVMPGALQSFDAFVNCMPAPICELAVCDLSENYFNLQNELHDDIDWRTWSGSTGSPNTGPSFDHTTGTSDGKYLYIRAAVVCFFKEASLMLPCVDLTEAQAPALDFWYHAYGSDIGSLHVDVFDGETIHRDIVLPVIGNQGDEWKNMVIDLSEFVGKSVGIRIRGRTGGGVAGDLSLDDISITEVTSVGNGSPITGNLTIYPNPTTGAVNIKAGETGDNEYFLTIFDLYGRVVYTRPAQTADGRLDISLDLAHMPRGLYFVRLNSSNKTYLGITPSWRKCLEQRE